MMSSPNDLKLVSLTWPIFFEIFLFMLIGSVDIYMISAISDDAVAAVGMSHQMIMIAILILEVIGNGAAIVVAQYIGSRKFTEAAKISGVAITLNLMVGLFISIIFIVFGGWMLKTLNLQGDILVYGKTYLLIVGGGIFLQALINIFAAIIRTYGYTKETMLVSLLMNIIHLVLNYLFIFGHLGFSEMGVKGAALSNIFSRLICLGIFFWLLYRLMSVRIRWTYYIHLSKEYIRKILKIGVPSAVEQIMYQCCQLVFFFYTTYIGAEALATKQYAANISMFIFLFCMAVSMGTAIITGRLIGAGEPEEAYRRVRQSLKWSMVVTIAVNIIVIILREPLLGLFTDNKAIIQLGSQILLISILLETGRTGNIVMINSLRAAGDAKFPLYMGIISMVGVSLPLGYILAFQLDLGLVGIWIANATDEWIRSIIMHFRWKSRAWEKHALVNHDHAEQKEPIINPV
ncbi:MATE family efflux transporter [Bacillus sp. 03113]|uniref:MATE family efflux transporter n=1 Tax=Bacillus sp. 03113 TaxID=2578211 RepID=UPI0011417B49|nr:MATE family efflux transporter [Bacillus sp. 03113]